MAGNRLKTRMEALESFREASTASSPQSSLLEMSSPEFHAVKGPERPYFSPTTSPATSIPSPHRLYGNSKENPTPMSFSERDECHTTPFQAPSKHEVAMVTPSLDTILSFKDQSGHDLWDLSHALNISRDIEDINEPRDAEYPNTPEESSSDLIKEVRATEQPLLRSSAPRSLVASSTYYSLTYDC